MCRRKSAVRRNSICPWLTRQDYPTSYLDDSVHNALSLSGQNLPLRRRDPFHLQLRFRLRHEVQCKAYLRDQRNAETITALTERTAQLQQDVTVLTQQVEVLKQANADLTQGKLNLKISHDELLKQVDQLKDIEKAAEIYKRIVTELMTVHDVQLSSYIARVMMTPENLRHTVLGTENKFIDYY